LVGIWVLFVDCNYHNAVRHFFSLALAFNFGMILWICYPRILQCWLVVMLVVNTTDVYWFILLLICKFQDSPNLLVLEVYVLWCHLHYRISWSIYVPLSGLLLVVLKNKFSFMIRFGFIGLDF
jgi:hypothetical protein